MQWATEICYVCLIVMKIIRDAPDMTFWLITDNSLYFNANNQFVGE